MSITMFYIIGLLLLIALCTEFYLLGKSKGEIIGFDKCKNIDERLLQLQKLKIKNLYKEIEELSNDKRIA